MACTGGLNDPSGSHGVRCRAVLQGIRQAALLPYRPHMIWCSGAHSLMLCDRCVALRRNFLTQFRPASSSTHLMLSVSRHTTRGQ